MYDLIIIGSGPAGLGAAIYGKRAGYSTLVLEKNPMSGGQVLNTCEVDNYLGLPGINGFDLGMQFREHADRLGTEFVEADVTGIKNLPDCKKVLTSAGEFTAKAVIIAAGAEHKKLGVPGEKRLAGRGISYCATCDGAFYKKKVTAVIGGGDVAVEDAIFLAGLCEKVYLIHRRDSLRAGKEPAGKAVYPAECGAGLERSCRGNHGRSLRDRRAAFGYTDKRRAFCRGGRNLYCGRDSAGVRELQEPCKNGRSRLYLCGRGLLHERTGHFCSRGCADEKAASDRDGGCRRGKCGQLCAGIFPDTVKKQRPKGKLLVAGAAKDALAV